MAGVNGYQSKIDDKKSDDQTHRIIRLIETKLLLMIYCRISNKCSSSIRRLKANQSRLFRKFSSNKNYFLLRGHSGG